MAKMPKEVIDLLNDPESSRVLATSDGTGMPNVVPKGSLHAIDEETIVFGDIWGNQTNTNLNTNGKAVVSVYKVQPHPTGYQVKGTFQGFQTSGPLFENLSKAVKKKVKLDIRAVGVIKVDEVYTAAHPQPGAKIA